MKQDTNQKTKNAKEKRNKGVKVSYESRIASNAYADTLQESRLEQLKKHKKVVKEIKAKDTEETNNLHTNPDKVKRQQTIAQTQNTGIQQYYKPIFKWEKGDDKDTFHIIPTEKTITFNSLYDIGSSSNHLLSLLGYKIDITQQVDQFKKKLQKFFIESKSHNAMVGKFSELKFGIVAALLSLLGVDPNSIEKLKKEALKKAIQDNIDCFEQNEYNSELITVFTKTRKDKGRVKILTALRKQLIKQMKNYGQPDYYTKDMIYTIKKDQIKKILGDLLEEKQNLSYIRNFQ